jgi:putative phage-type endonuclease
MSKCISNNDEPLKEIDEKNTKNVSNIKNASNTKNASNVSNASNNMCQICSKNTITNTEIQHHPYTTTIYGEQFDDDVSDKKIKKRQNIVKKLMQLEFPAQKSLKWLELRNGKVTASDGGCVIGENHYEPFYKFIQKKVLNPPFQSNINCYHGNKYEQIATMIYEYRMNVNVHEFGLIVHPTCKFLAASPDGIISSYKYDKQHQTKHVGRMLEIKCPVTRKINMDGEIKGGICPIYYYDQVQLQLECCDLDECDFWQCKLFEYEGRDEFLEDTDLNESFRSKTNGYEKGVIIQLLPKRIPNFSDDFIKQLDEYKNKYNEYKKSPESTKEYFNEFKKIMISNCNLDKFNDAELDDYIKYLLRGKVIECEHSKNHYCNYWKKKDPDNCDYCEFVYAYSKHIYPPKIDMTPYECDNWIHEVITNYHKQTLLDPTLNVNDYYIDRIIYWRLDISHCVTINRDKEWFNNVLPEIEKIWNFVELFRKDEMKSKLFFDYIKSLTVESKFIKNKDNEMSEENIEKIMKLAELLYDYDTNDSKNTNESLIKLIKKRGFNC